MKSASGEENMRCGLIASLTVMVVALVAHPAPANAQQCVFPKGDATSLSEMRHSIMEAPVFCALPWRALKRVVADPQAAAQLRAAYDDVAKREPRRAFGATANSARVAAAAGHPEEMLAIADANVTAHPDDKTLPNMSCYARGAYGFDLPHAMPYCDAAVTSGQRFPGLVNRGRVELGLGRNRAALADFDAAIVDPEFRVHFFAAHALYGRGIARLRLGDARGKDDLQRAVAMNATIAATFADAGITP
ncbi:hypothetical protein BH10PSE14_BH10PSE14_19620 [soil metagenome]